MILILKIKDTGLNPNIILSTLSRNLTNLCISNIVIFTDCKLTSSNKRIKIIDSLPTEKNCILQVKNLYSNEDIFLWSADWNTFFNVNLSKYNNKTNQEVYYQITDGEYDFIIFNKNSFNAKFSSIIDCFISKKIDISEKKLCILKRTNIITSQKPEIIRVKGKQTSDIKTDYRQILKIDVVIVSVNYNDFLVLSILHNKKYFSNLIVVTTIDDVKCQEICKKFDVKCVLTDRLTNEGEQFNKGKAINDGIKSIDNPDWILLLDADILVTKKIENDKLEKDTLYTSDRYHCYDNTTLKKWKNSEISLHQLGEYEINRGYGFFQLFNINSTRINREMVYSEEYDNASNSDIDFLNLFEKKQEINTCIHLGDPKKNWKGRSSEKFISDDELQQIIDINQKKIEIEKKLSKEQICTYEGLMKQNIRIISNIDFNFNKGGIYNPSIINCEGKKYIIARCEKDFDAYTGIYENYWKSVLPPMFFEINETYSIISYGIFRMKDFPIISRFEDFRVFYFDNKIYTNHNLTTPNYEYDSGSTWTNMHISTKPGVIVKSEISEIDIKNETIERTKIQNFSPTKLEKNWSFFTKDDDLYFIYSLEPFIIYKKVNDEFIKIIEKNYRYEWNIISDSSMKFCISTNLQRITDDYYLLFFHTKTKGYKYVQGCMLLNNNLEPTYMTKNPILSCEELKGKYPGVIYVFSVDVKDDEIDVYYGEADTNCCVAVFDKNKIIEHITISENSFRIEEI